MAREKHQTPTRSGTRAHIRIHGVLHRRHFTTGTDPLTIRQWLLTQEMKYRKPGTTQSGKFDDDARVYLAAVQAMPTFATRTQHIEEWIAVFGSRHRDSLTSAEIAAQLQVWRTEMRTVKIGTSTKTRDLILSVSAVNHRRTALMHLFTVLDGKAAVNPVRNVPKFRESSPAPRALPYAQIRKLLATMPANKSKARLMVLAYTGIPHKQITRITRADVNLKARTVAVYGREKGAGTAGRIVPLTTDGVTAFKAMIKAEAWGKFSASTLRRLFLEAAASAKLKGTFTPYDLRHSFGTEIFKQSGNIRATQLLMGHADPRQTHRYTVGAQDGSVLSAIKTWNAKR